MRVPGDFQKERLMEKHYCYKTCVETLHLNLAADWSRDADAPEEQALASEAAFVQHQTGE